MRLWDAASGQQVAALAGHNDSIACVSLSPDGKTLACGSYDASARLWDAASCEQVAALDQRIRSAYCVLFRT